MTTNSVIAQFKQYSVPLFIFLIVALAAVIVPPLVLGEATGRTFALTAAVIILAVGAALPYAVLVGVGTLPLLYIGVASFAAPATDTDVAHSFSTGIALRHVAAGVLYILAAAVVGAIGIGAQIGVGGDYSTLPPVLQQLLLYIGGVIVAGGFVLLQLWRYDRHLRTLSRLTILGTIALGVLLAITPAVALWVFQGAT